MDISLVSIPAGSIVLRDDRKKQQWPVQVPAFQLATTPITQACYEQVMGCNPALNQGAQRPVDSVSWLDAIAFCNALSVCQGLTPAYQLEDDQVRQVSGANGYYLPSDAQWEYACRAGSSEPRYGVLDDIAWYEGNTGEGSQPVAQKQPNAFGLYDMLGNVWEWCWDIYDAEVYKSYRIFRGGGWADGERGVLAGNRRRSHPTYAIDDLGFRVARSEGKMVCSPTTGLSL
ncbi:formylglycine-generating enzyme family protein [Salinibius halmophilus]|uniref:formylglycine-generating enzyme family protein n=1 Tax=Salinibius halmophilus TaxID=1853216 RepID=UPI000E660E1E|nr:formylglycine-generating enzyme family protein [Salinibius halmophilus]